MKLTSLLFIAFVFLSCLIYYLTPQKMRWFILLAFSLIFYVVSSGILTLYMLATTLIIYLGALLLSKRADNFELRKKSLDKEERKAAKRNLKRTQKLIVAAVTAAVLGILAVLKYCNLGIEFANLFHSLFHTGIKFESFRLMLPLGISYYSLMAVSYVTDVYRGTVKAEKNPLRLLLFVCYFPHIVEGPFDRYKELSNQFSAPKRFDYDSFCKGMILVILGFLKKLVIADRLGITVSTVFNDADGHSGPTILIATVLYTIQLYFDFSGCIDIVSGVSSMYGIKIAKNFRQPFFSKSIAEFWRRWHISLGLWLKEYVYYPVVLSGHFKAVDRFAKKHLKSERLISLIPAAYALFFVWFSNGLWHGASVKYILYGLYYYFLMMLGEFCKPFFEKFKNKLRIKETGKPFALYQMIRTFAIVNIGMLLFRSQNISEFGHLLIKMFSQFNYFSGAKDIYVVSANNSVHLWIPMVGLLIGFTLSLLKERTKIDGDEDIIWSMPFVLRDLLIVATIVFIILFGVYGSGFDASDFVYAQF